MMHKNDLLICAPERDNPANSEFDIYARVTNVENGFVTLDKYQKYGALKIKNGRIPENELNEYYRPMTEEEKQRFADTMFSCKVSLKNSNMYQIHLGGDYPSGWEDVQGDLLDTLAVLADYRTVSKDGEVNRECEQESMEER